MTVHKGTYVCGCMSCGLELAVTVYETDKQIVAIESMPSACPGCYEEIDEDDILEQVVEIHEYDVDFDLWEDVEWT